MLIELYKKDRIWFAMAMQICKNKEDSEDLVQDMYYNIAKRVTDKEKLTNKYVNRVIKNLFLDKLKKDKHKPIMENLDYFIGKI